MSIAMSISGLIKKHQFAGSIAPNFLNPGLDPSYVRRKMAHFGFPAQNDIFELYAIADGSILGKPPFFADGMEFLPLSRAFLEYKDLAGLIDDSWRLLYKRKSIDANIAPCNLLVWHEQWFPFAMALGEVMAVDCRLRGPSFGGVIRWSPQFDARIAFPSLEAFITAQEIPNNPASPS